MRVSNVVIGFLLAIAIAYIHDAAVEPFSASGKPLTIVNWDVFGQSVSDVGIWLRQELGRLMDFVHSRA